MGDIAALRGVWNIVPTPFMPDGELDEASITSLVEFVIETGVDGLTILGVLGEAGKLGDAERTRVIEVALDTAAGRIPVCVGVSHAATGRAVAFAKEAEAAGAHSVMLAPPAMARPTDAGLRRHYLAVADAIGIPVVVQDHPASSGVQMSVEFLVSLFRERPSCGVVKLEEEPTPPKAGRLLEAAPELRVLGGLGGEMLLEELRRGTHGTMTGFGFPEVLVAIVRRWFDGDRETAALLFDRYASVIRFENQALLNLPIRKLVYQQRGAIAHATVRAPGGAVDPGTASDLGELLQRTGLASHLAAGAMLEALLGTPGTGVSGGPGAPGTGRA
jgi:4-hydroxy-tetrahydrodipicolinate synthase